MTALSYLTELAFVADPFQVQAAEAIDRGESVVVTAPTGSGKTVVAESAIHRTLEVGQRAMYTTPIKALSNQKFAEFGERYGTSGVGLLTGDNSINPTAPVVVMTTEVLRNMMYAESPDLDNIGVVILDEVHYLANRERGGVWEEIIIHLDRTIPLICLSATVANARDFAGWIEERRGPTTLIIEEERPVPLEVDYMLRDRFADHDLRLMPVLNGTRPNERISSMLRRDRSRNTRYLTPRRHETCELLDQLGLLPAIYFIFSRKGCDGAARTVVQRGLRLTSHSEADFIAQTARRALAHLAPDDLEVLGFEDWLRLLSSGVSPHHAGMVPAMKETVEQLFAAGLVRLVFATETLALGINMPARSVVLENVAKFNGESHELLRPGDFTQLTGRAGRRGIDSQGNAVVLHSPYVEFDQVAAIASRGSHPLASSFRPTYNMTVNLVARYDQTRAETLLGASFAEYARDRQRRNLDSQMAQDEARLAEVIAAAEHPDLEIRSELDSSGDIDGVTAFVASSPPGTVLEWEERGGWRRVVVVAVGTGKQPRLLGVTEKAETHRFASQKLPSSLRRVGQITLPVPFRPRHAPYRLEVADRLGRFVATDPPVLANPAIEASAENLAHHLEAPRSARRVEARLEARRRQASTVGPSILSRFQAISGVLSDLGYMKRWTLSSRGETLRTVYNELDLVLVESLSDGAFAGLRPSGIAALASTFTYQPRGTDEPATWPTALAEQARVVEAAHSRVTGVERKRRVAASRPPDPGFATKIAAWADGAQLNELFDEESAPIGDFVRNTNQLLDLLHQLSDLEGINSADVKTAIRLVDRGVVAAAGAV